MQPKGVYLTFGVFVAVSLVGFLLSFGVKGRSLEADFGDSDDNYKSDDEEAGEANDER